MQLICITTSHSMLIPLFVKFVLYTAVLLEYGIVVFIGSCVIFTLVIKLEKRWGIPNSLLFFSTVIFLSSVLSYVYIT